MWLVYNKTGVHNESALKRVLSLTHSHYGLLNKIIKFRTY